MTDILFSSVRDPTSFPVQRRSILEQADDKSESRVMKDLKYILGDGNGWTFMGAEEVTDVKAGDLTLVNRSSGVSLMCWLERE